MSKLYDILSPAQAARIAENLQDWEQGKARTPELTGTVKQNEEIIKNPLLSAIGRQIAVHKELQLDCIPAKIHQPKFSRYTVGQHYKRHTDAPWMGQTRTDLSCTLWLNDDFKGGDLVIDGQSFRGKPGQALIYQCERPHEVTPVTEGERICAVTWIQSRIREAHKRNLVTDMRKFLSNFEGSDWFVDGGRIHTALIRMWMD